MASPSAGAPALKYGDVNTETPSPGKVKELIIINKIKMYLLSLLMILITSFKSIFSLKNEYISNCNYNLRRLRNNTFITESEYIDDCKNLVELINNVMNVTDLNFTKIIIYTLNSWKNNSTEFIIFANYSKLFLNECGPKIFVDLDKIGKLIYNITKEILNNDTMVNQFAEIIKPKNNKTIFADLIIELLLYSIFN